MSCCIHKLSSLSDINKFEMLICLSVGLSSVYLSLCAFSFFLFLWFLSLSVFFLCCLCVLIVYLVICVSSLCALIVYHVIFVASLCVLIVHPHCVSCHVCPHCVSSLCVVILYHVICVASLFVLIVRPHCVSCHLCGLIVRPHCVSCHLIVFSVLLFVWLYSLPSSFELTFLNCFVDDRLLPYSIWTHLNVYWISINPYRQYMDVKCNRNEVTNPYRSLEI